MTLKTVEVPENMAEKFESAQDYVKKYFEELKMDPEEGTITIGEDRYIILRASSPSVHFLEFVRNMYPALEPEEAREASSRVQYDFARAIGRADARHFHEATNVEEAIEKLSTGPIHFAYTGWAKVIIHPDSKPSVSEDFYLHYEHLNTFEADSWLALRGGADFCTCFWSAGYSAGWCTESFGVDLDAREVTCRARGDDACLFIMVHSSRLPEAVARWRKEHEERG